MKKILILTPFTFMQRDYKRFGIDILKKFFVIKIIDFSLGKTAELIKNSSLVMLHSSTALSFAILFKKPTIFITTDELKKSWLRPRIKNFSKQVGRKPVNIDEDLGPQLNLKEIFMFDKEKYSNYINQYLKAPNSPDIPLWEIVCNFLNNKYKY